MSYCVHGKLPKLCKETDGGEKRTGEVPLSQELLLDLCDEAIGNRYRGVGESWATKSIPGWLLRSCQEGLL